MAEPAFRDAAALCEWMRSRLNLSDDEARLARHHVDAQLASLSERGASAAQGLSFLAAFAEQFAAARGEGFVCRVQRRAFPDGVALTGIEPPCGGNAWVLEKGDALLFIDCGYALYRSEFFALAEQLFPGFDKRPRALVLTHPDMDHCGLMNDFPLVYASRDTLRHFECNLRGEPDFRERRPMQAPYVGLTRVLARHPLPDIRRIHVVEGEPDDGGAVCLAGRIDFHGIALDLYRGNGGHAVGECALVDEAHRLVFSGDMLLDPARFSPEQTAFNRLAPFLMGGVNLDSAQAIRQRAALRKRFSPERYSYCCGHGTLIEGAPAPQSRHRPSPKEPLPDETQ